MQKYTFATILSFFLPGLGQLIKKDFNGAIKFFLIHIFAWICSASFLAPIALLVIIANWVWSMYDAYNTQVDEPNNNQVLEK